MKSVKLAACVWVGVAVGVVLASTGCDAEPEPPLPTPSASVSESPSVGPRAVAESEAVAAYRGMWDAFVEAAKTSDPDAPQVREYASDQALRLIVGALVTNREQGEVILGDLVIDPKVTASQPPDTPTEVSIVDCVNSEKWLEHKVSGGLVDDEPGGKHRTTATVAKTGGVWKVSSFILEDSGTC